jgi:TetR/AcrR family transcriptional regulator
VEGVSVARIAREAGVGKATVFHHFPSKDALHQAVLWQVNDQALWLIEDQDWQDGDLESCMARFIQEQIRLFEEDDSLLRLIRREVLEGRVQFLESISEVFIGPFERLRGHLEDRRRAGDLADDADTGLLAWQLMEVGVNFHEGGPVLSRVPGLEVARGGEAFSRAMARLLMAGARPASNQ